MNQNKVFQQVLDQIDWIRSIIIRRGWDINQDLIYREPASVDEVKAIEEKIGIQLPKDYKQLLTECSRNFEFRYQFDEELPEEFKGIFSGEIYWNLDRFIEQYNENYVFWEKDWLDISNSDKVALEQEAEILRNKVPLMEVPNGDLIVVGYNSSEVVYFSHEGDEMHGKVLGDSLWSFLEFHSRVGFIGSEDWQFEPFFDYEQNKMITTGPKVERFISWLEE
ncbi:SMI1/KNR4 family protein [Pontibacter liquoris]|uniref:SMI1/KNR4 family protein n=1 Tax=Pontibacter liquoris TaxID=2905677 RepID=UPI001FA72E58|nr:SMI1/KNR4 family protein [Pontibacter liquoris]